MPKSTQSQLDALQAANAASAQDARDRIFRALIALAKDKAWADITVSDIVRVSKVSRSAFYHHFRSKDDVVDQCLAEVGAGIAAIDHKNSMEVWVRIFDAAYRLRPIADIISQSQALTRVLGFMNSLPTEGLTPDEIVAQLIWNGACFNLISLYLSAEIDMPPHEMARLTAQALARGEAEDLSPLIKSKSTEWLEKFNPSES